MNFYMISKFSTKDIIREKIKEVEKIGFKVTHNWTLEKNYSKEKSTQVEQDINGVINSDFVIAIIDNPKYHYRGSFAEIGCALGLDKPVYLVTNNLEEGSARHCFLFHKNIIRFQSWEGLIKFLNYQINIIKK